MTNNELNAYILHYLEHDKTNRAIMLTGAWGSGKSHYIKNDLVPYLEKDGESRCVVVSLYGIKDVSEISKSIYLELRAKHLRSKKETTTAGKVIAKTIAKGVTSYFGIDLSLKDETLQELYESVDLSDKLIVFEDLERSLIEMPHLLGYVNHLVEQDGIKVLLVANEDEFIQYQEIETGTDEKKQKVLTPESETYYATKEKTVGDTIQFEGNLKDAVKAIIKRFGYSHLSAFLENRHIEDVCDLLAINNYRNLRTFIYACQKTQDIINLAGEALGPEDRIIVFYSVIMFSKHIKNGRFPKWEGSKYLSTTYTLTTIPLYRFCYDYIRYQKFEIESVRKALEEHNEFRLYQRHSNDPDLNVICSFFIYPEETVLQSLNNIMIKINNPSGNTISICDYGKLSYYLVMCRSLLGFDYSSLKQSMIRNIKDYGREIDEELLFLSVDSYSSKELNDELEKIKEEILSAFRETKQAAIMMNYSPADISEYYTFIARNKHEIRAKHVFISMLDVDRLVDMVYSCNAMQLHDLRGIFDTVYRDGSIGSFEEDISHLIQFKEKVKDWLQNQPETQDRIIRYQIELLCDDLTRYIYQLSGF